MTSLASRDGTTDLVVETDEPTREEQLELHRRELTGYCYRMLGSGYDAEDAVQEVMVRAWRALDKFDGRSTLRTWLYRIATNVCFDALEGTRKRAMPMDMSPTASPPVQSSLGKPLPETTWVEPVPDGRVLPDSTDPAELSVLKESVRMAFVAALQHLPPRQRAVLILRDVLRWKAEEVATLLESTTASVNSALQRARATMGSEELAEKGRPADAMDAEHRALLERYLVAFESYDVDGLVALLHEDATQSMPPFSLWLDGPRDIGLWMLGPGAECEDSRLAVVQANGSTGFAQWRRKRDGEGYEPFSIHLLQVRDGKVVGITNFLGATHFRTFGLGDQPPAEPARFPAA